MRSRFVNRGLGAVSRRLGRPELLAVVNAPARQLLHEDIALTAVLAAALPADGIYVDVGTNRGQILREALRVAPSQRHIAFEPVPSLAAEVARTFPSVECRALAVGARPEEAQFCHFRALDGWSGLRRSQLISDERGDPEFIAVNVSTLDRELGDVMPSVIKIDVEGAELEVLKGAGQVLRRARPLLVFEHVAEAAAIYGASSVVLWNLLADLGYEVFPVTGGMPVARAAFDANTTVVNWLAKPIRDFRRGS